MSTFEELITGVFTEAGLDKRDYEIGSPFDAIAGGIRLLNIAIGDEQVLFYKSVRELDDTLPKSWEFTFYTQSRVITGAARVVRQNGFHYVHFEGWKSSPLPEILSIDLSIRESANPETFDEYDMKIDIEFSTESFTLSNDLQEDVNVRVRNALGYSELYRLLIEVMELDRL